MHIGSGAAPITLSLRAGMAMLAMALSGCSAGIAGNLGLVGALG